MPTFGFRRKAPSREDIRPSTSQGVRTKSGSASPKSPVSPLPSSVGWPSVSSAAGSKAPTAPVTGKPTPYSQPNSPTTISSFRTSTEHSASTTTAKSLTSARSTKSFNDDNDSTTSTSASPSSPSVPRRTGPQRGQTPLPAAKSKFLRVPSLIALQAETPEVGDAHLVEPVAEDDPASYELVPPEREGSRLGHTIIERADLLLGRRHLEIIFEDPRLYKNFISFIQTYKQASIPRLTRYRQAKKAIQAIKYANAISASLTPVSGHDFTNEVPENTSAETLEKLADQAMHELVREDLPAYICAVWIPIISKTVHQRINGALSPELKRASEGLAEVFCLTDPRQKDDPIVLASKEFTTTTQYGLGFVCGQNCRFLQGTRTDPMAVDRIRSALKARKEHSEILLNYRRDGSPFMNLCMLVPLTDLEGNLKYFLGAQVDVSGLLRSSAGLESLARLSREVLKDGDADFDDDETDDGSRLENGDLEFKRLAEMFDEQEMHTVKFKGGAMHREGEIADTESILSDATSMISRISDRPRLMLVDPNEQAYAKKSRRPGDTGVSSHRRRRPRASPAARRAQQLAAEATRADMNRRLETMYKDFVLVRPAPNFTITFTSSTLADENLAQTDFFSHIGGSMRVRDGLMEALTEGHKVTAKVRWMSEWRRRRDLNRSTSMASVASKDSGEVLMTAAPSSHGSVSERSSDDGELRWIHCTPLLGGDGRIGVWVVMLIDP